MTEYVYPQRTQIEITAPERDAMDYLKTHLGLTTDAAVRRFCILQVARANGWSEAEAEPTKPTPKRKGK